MARQKPPDTAPDGTAVYAADVTMADRQKKTNFSVEKQKAQTAKPSGGGEAQSPYFPKIVTGPVEQPPARPARPLVPPPSAEAQKRPVQAPQRRPPPLPPETIGGKSEAGQIVFNFDDADIYEVIRTMAELLNINYIVDPGVRGKVTIHTARGIRKEELFTVFYQILEANGLTAVREGLFYKVVPMKDSQRQSIYPSYGRDTQGLPTGQRMVIQIIPLIFIQAAEMSKLLTPFVSAEGTIISDKDSNTLVVVDRERNIDKIVRLVDGFDVDMFDRFHHRFFALEYTEAEDIAKAVTDIAKAYGTSLSEGVSIIPIKRLNTLLAVSTNPQALGRIQMFIETLDVSSEGSEHRIYVYSVRNGAADDLAGILGSVFAKTSAADADKSKKDVKEKKKPDTGVVTEPGKDLFKSKNPFAVQPKQKKESPKPKTTFSGDMSGSGTLKDEIGVTADMVRNVLIIEAIPSDYRIVLDILKRLDVLPRQVLIEATIAEISLDAKLELGVDWSYTKNVYPGAGLLSGTIDGLGLVALVGVGNRVLAQIELLETQNKVNILSSPHVLASDNQEAKIDVSQEIPIASSETVVTSGNSPLVTTAIQYRDAGVILSVTPHVNERGLVTLDISQEVSEQSGDVEVAGTSYPSFFKRVIDTTLTVQHGQTIVLGGLIRETKSITESGVPWFVKLPFIGWLFGQTSDIVSKTELIVLLTPLVVINPDDIDIITEDFENKVGNVMRDFSEHLKAQTQQRRPIKELREEARGGGSSPPAAP